MASCALFIVVLIFGSSVHCSSRFRKQTATVETLKETKEEVRLSVMSSANEILTEARLGQDVRLAISLKNKPGTTTSSKGVSLFNCVCMTADGSQVKQLTDEHGCSVAGSPILNMSSVLSNVFPLFTLRGHTDITFQCDFEFCFQELDMKCKNRCLESSTNNRRRRSDANKDNKKHLSTQIRVLPSVKDEEIEMPNYDGWASRAEGPLLYLNPVTCSLFIILLTIFLALYVIFIKSLKRSVDQIKEDMTQGRNRLRFIDGSVYCSLPVQPQTTTLP